MDNEPASLQSGFGVQKAVTSGPPSGLGVQKAVASGLPISRIYCCTPGYIAKDYIYRSGYIVKIMRQHNSMPNWPIKGKNHPSYGKLNMQRESASAEGYKQFFLKHA